MNQYDYSQYQFGSVECVFSSAECRGSESRWRIHSGFRSDRRLQSGTVGAFHGARALRRDQSENGVEDFILSGSNPLGQVLDWKKSDLRLEF